MARERWEMFSEEQDEKRIKLFESHKQTCSQLINELLAFNQHRPTPNILPSNDEFKDLGVAELMNTLSITTTKLKEWSSKNVKAGEVVFKRGRTTGLTIGKLSAINPRVQLDGKICCVWQVVGQPRKPFCRKGDSGSFVIDSVGRWCTLLFASPYKEMGDAYVLLVDILIADVESMTGGTVSFLQYMHPGYSCPSPVFGRLGSSSQPFLF
ncbi:MAG: hypothetical protein M1839_000452 [Geoglossum umbratile]|nr:MAG: hypothetical protein M1839_000452 [Geoglossum umbratile]